MEGFKEFYLKAEARIWPWHPQVDLVNAIFTSLDKAADLTSPCIFGVLFNKLLLHRCVINQISVPKH